MAFPNVTDIVATTIEHRSKKIADNVTKNNAYLTRLKQRGGSRPFAGGRLIYEEVSFAENGNAGWYSGYDLLPVAAQDVITAGEWQIKQAACPVVCSGLEQLQNAGKEQMIDLLESRLNVAEATMANLVSGGIYSDGTGAAGKEIDGLDAQIPLDPTVGTYGGIDRATWNFWRSKVVNSANADNIDTDMNTLWSQLVRGMDAPDLILSDNVAWNAYIAKLQSLQRFATPEVGELGFPSVKFMSADVVLDGGIGGFCPAGTMFFLNTKYAHYRPHSARNFTNLSPNKRYAINQDAETTILAWAGNCTSSGPQFQGRLDVNA